MARRTARRSLTRCSRWSPRRAPPFNRRCGHCDFNQSSRARSDDDCPSALLPFVQLRPPRSLDMWKWLLTGERNAWYYQCVRRNRSLELVWREHRDVVVAHYAKRWAGSRPKAWWRWDAPEPRRRLGGSGVPLMIDNCDPPSLAYGVPRVWHFSEADPPQYESEASYLKRLNLLLPGERRRLKQSDFTPQFVRGCFDDPRTYWRAAEVA